MKISKKGYGVWVLGAVLLAISLCSYVPVSLGLAKGFMLAAGQVAGLAAGAVYLIFFKRQDQECDPKRGEKKGEGVFLEGLDRRSLGAMLKTTISAVGYICAFVCFFLLLTFPLQNLLAGFGVASLNECAHYENFWEIILYVLILPPVCLEVLHRLIVFPCLSKMFSKSWQIVLTAGLFYTFSAPQIGNFLARFAIGALLALLFLRTGSFLACFCGALAAQSVFFIAGYLQILGFAGAEGYAFPQCVGMGLAFAMPGAVIFYFNEKIATKKKVRLLELALLAGGALLGFFLGMALWLG